MSPRTRLAMFFIGAALGLIFLETVDNIRYNEFTRGHDEGFTLGKLVGMQEFGGNCRMGEKTQDNQEKGE